MYWLGLLASSPRDIAISKVPCSYHFSVRLHWSVPSIENVWKWGTAHVRWCKKEKLRFHFQLLLRKQNVFMKVTRQTTVRGGKRNLTKMFSPVQPGRSGSQWLPATKRHRTQCLETMDWLSCPKLCTFSNALIGCQWKYWTGINCEVAMEIW